MIFLYIWFIGFMVTCTADVDGEYTFWQLFLAWPFALGEIVGGMWRD